MVPLENGTKQNEKANAMERSFPSRRPTCKLAAKRFWLRFVSYPITLSDVVQLLARVLNL